MDRPLDYEQLVRDRAAYHAVQIADLAKRVTNRIAGCRLHAAAETAVELRKHLDCEATLLAVLSQGQSHMREGENAEHR